MYETIILYTFRNFNIFNILFFVYLYAKKKENLISNIKVILGFQ